MQCFIEVVHRLCNVVPKPPSEVESERFLAAAAAEARRAVQHRAAVLAHVGAEAFTADDHASLEPDDWRHTTGRDDITAAEVQLAKRCHGAHIEMLRCDTTPTASHYQLIHYDVPLINPKEHVLRVHGMVQRELHLTMDDIRVRPASTHSVLMACAGTGRMMQKTRLWTHVPWGPDSFGCARWTGCSLADVLQAARPSDGAAQVIFTGADKGVEGGKVQHFQRSLSLDDAMLGHVILCYQMNGEDLTPAHGAPVRIIVPGWYGMASVKWLTSIEVTAGGWWGHQMHAYSAARSANDPARVPLEQLPVRALMAPPGHPDFFSRTRIVAPGTTRIAGRAWAGAVELARVEFSSDGGSTWKQAVLGPKNGAFGWASWHIDWDARKEGVYVLMCRAFDAFGRSQDLPGDTQFNWGSFGSTQPQQIYVKVDKAIEVPGSTIDLDSEQMAAKVALRHRAGLSEAHVEALYRAPGSQ